MAPITPCVSTCVGCIEEHDRRTHSKRTELIYYETELFIGRDANTCQFVIDDPLVSNKHLRIYTIIFDQGNPGEVAPLVYAQDLSTNGTWWNAYGMKRDHGGYLLSDGDILGVGSYITLTFKSNTNQLDVPFPRHQEDEMDRFRSEFEVTRRLLGSGAYGKVYMAFDKRSRKQVACKIVDTINLSRQGRQLDKRQTAIGEKNKEYANHEVELAHETGRQLKRSVKLKTQKTYVDWKLATYEREVEILQDLRHPNIIGLEKVFKSAKYM